MNRTIKRLTAVEYSPDGDSLPPRRTLDPAWPAVEAAIRRMDDVAFPIVQLQCTLADEDDDMFNVIGGNGRYALLQFMGDWQYTDPHGGDAIVRLWQSDQGYECAERHVLIDVEKVLRVVHRHFETGSYADLDQVR